MHVDKLELTECVEKSLSYECDHDILIVFMTVDPVIVLHKLLHY